MYVLSAISNLDMNRNSNHLLLLAITTPTINSNTPNHAGGPAACVPTGSFFLATATMNPNDLLLQQGQSAVNEMCTWIGSLPFRMSSTTEQQDTPKLIDISHEMDKHKLLLCGQKLFFDPTKYKVDKENLDNHKHALFRTLISDLNDVARQNGFSLSDKSTSTPQRPDSEWVRSVRLYCSHWNVCKMRKLDPETKRKHEWTNDKKNSRGKKGKSMPRSSSQTAVPDKNHRCHFALYLKLSKKGYFYTEYGRGNYMHTHHPPVDAHKIHFPSARVDKEDVQLILDVAASGGQDTAGRNIHFTRRGQLLKPQQIAYLKTKHDQSPGGIGAESDDPMVKLMEYCKQEGFPYCAMLHAPNTEEEPFVS